MSADTKLEWYKKLRVKLQRIFDEELSLSDYILEVQRKIDFPDSIEAKKLELSEYQKLLATKIYSRLGLTSFRDNISIDEIQKAIETDKKFANWADRTGALKLLDEFYASLEVTRI